jgi:hypothetical protein
MPYDGPLSDAVARLERENYALTNLIDGIFATFSIERNQKAFRAGQGGNWIVEYMMERRSRYRAIRDESKPKTDLGVIHVEGSD